MFLTVLPLFFIPESPRWLLKMGKTEKFVKTIRRGARINKVKNTKRVRKVKS